MAEFKEVMKQRSRMCKHYLSMDISCENCPLDKARKNTMFQCFRYIAEYYQEAENVIMEWAEEHPVEYPYMIDVLYDVFNMPKGLNVSNAGIWEWLNTIRISEDVAEKLGVKPKEE